jgi:hypothetical protein
MSEHAVALVMTLMTAAGVLAGPVTVLQRIRLGGYVEETNGYEVYLPPTSSCYPDHRLRIANRFPGQPPFVEATIEVIRPDGQVVAQIVPEAPLRESYLTGLSLRGTHHLLVGRGDQLWTIDFAGNIVAGPVAMPGPFVEGNGPERFHYPSGDH